MPSRIHHLTIADLADFTLHDPDGVVVIMPCIDAEVGMKTAEVLLHRAGMDCAILVVMDTPRQGYVKTLNQTAAKILAKYIVYLAQDAWPGRGWLKCAHDTLEKSGRGLLAFNDGKWHGRIASFGMVRKVWLDTLYGGEVFFSGYISHAADLELTVIAQAHGEHIYNPHCTLIELDAAKDFDGSNPNDQALYAKRLDQFFAGLTPASALQSISQNYAVTMVPPVNPTSGQTGRNQENESRLNEPLMPMEDAPSEHPLAKVKPSQPPTHFILHDALQTLGVSVILSSNANLATDISSFLAWNTHAPLEILVLAPEWSSNLAHIVSEYVPQAVIRLVVHDPLAEGLEDRPTGLAPSAYNYAASQARHPILLYLATSGSEQIGHDLVPSIVARMQDQTIGAVCLQVTEISRSRDFHDSPSHSVLGLATTRSLFHELGGFASDVTVGDEFVHYITQVGKMHRRVCWYTDGQWDQHVRALIRREAEVSANTAKRHDLPIVVVAYNRPASLIRLLHSLDTAQYNQEVQLIISVDGGDESSGVENMARTFQWRHGPKSVITHEVNLGLKAHVIKCCDLAMEHGGAIVLEDDLLVSPVFYDYSQQAFDFYKNEQRIAGISLYSHCFNETAQYPFYPIRDANNVFFMQIPASWGVVWTKEQWTGFKKWHERQGHAGNGLDALLPGDVLKWPETSWKKEFYRYILQTGKFFVYPRSSLSTNFADSGVHVKKSIKTFQVPLQYSKNIYVFVELDNSLAKYDAFCEILPECLNTMVPFFKSFDYCVDLYGMKPLAGISASHVLTTKKTKDYLCSFGREMHTHESNIIHHIHGQGFRFASKKSCPDIIDHVKSIDDYAHVDNIMYHYNIHNWILTAAFKKMHIEKK